MAQRVKVELIDDLNGQEAQETVRFEIDGTGYEIDLTTDNAARLRESLSRFVAQGRKASISRRGYGGPLSHHATQARREELQKVRQWAAQRGHSTSARGRISRSIMDAYDKVQG